MPDWKQIVRRNLRVLKVCSPELTEELAGHLEDNYEASLREGLPAEVAFHRTIGQIEGRCKSRLVLRFLKEDIMTGFTRKVGLPGLLTFASAMAIGWVLNFAHIQPKTIFLSDGLFLSLPIAWMCLLPVCGALGTVISRRNGGSHLDRMVAAAFPAIIFGLVLLLICVVGWAISLFVPNYGWNWRLVAWGLGLWGFGYSILPAVALLLGSAAADQAKNKRPRAV